MGLFSRSLFGGGLSLRCTLFTYLRRASSLLCRAIVLLDELIALVTAHLSGSAAYYKGDIVFERVYISVPVFITTFRRVSDY